jgi:ribonuclease P protein component
MVMAARARSAEAPDVSFPPARRIRKPSEFKQVYAAGRRLGNEFFTASAQPNALPGARLGMSVAVRTMGNAVARNRVRRLIRESFRLNQTLIPPLDIVIGVRVSARGAEGARLRSSLEQLWQKIAFQCARSSER